MGSIHLYTHTTCYLVCSELAWQVVSTCIPTQPAVTAAVVAAAVAMQRPRQMTTHRPRFRMVTKDLESRYSKVMKLFVVRPVLFYAHSLYNKARMIITQLIETRDEDNRPTAVTHAWCRLPQTKRLRAFNKRKAETARRRALLFKTQHERDEINYRQ
ncbi:hypothetical protein J6590_022568 [Homalodisca vitripennis]|nr:hypothetical protein J6590_022568 [Homalodisca vitripennis]